MKNEYRSAMDKIHADKELSDRLLEMCKNEQPAVKREKPRSVKAPLIAALSSAAALALLLYSTVAVMSRRNARQDEGEFVIEQAIVSNDRTASDNAGENKSGDEQPRAAENDGNITETPDAAEGSAGDDREVSEKGAEETENGEDASSSSPSASGGALSQEDGEEEQPDQSFPVTFSDELRVVTYLSDKDLPSITNWYSDVMIKYDSIFHFEFNGFAKFGKPLLANNVMFDATLSESYTVSDLIDDYYNIISGTTGVAVIRDGRIYSFYGVAAEGRQIRLYIDGVEI